MATLITTAKISDIDPSHVSPTWAHIAETPQSRMVDLLPWNWSPPHLQTAA